MRKFINRFVNLSYLKLAYDFKVSVPDNKASKLTLDSNGSKSECYYSRDSFNIKEVSYIILTIPENISNVHIMADLYTVVEPMFKRKDGTKMTGMKFTVDNFMKSVRDNEGNSVLNILTYATDLHSIALLNKNDKVVGFVS